MSKKTRSRINDGIAGGKTHPRGKSKSRNHLEPEGIYRGRPTDTQSLSVSEKIEIIRRGISKKQLTTIKNELNLDYDELSAVLSTSRSTLINKKSSEKFDAPISEKIMLLNDVLGYGRLVFGDNNIFNNWLRTPSQALGKTAPLSLMDTLYGIDEVKKEIGRIEYGVY
jgi:putative toxin-antitoxin system antitoxin component (TIGR02293 family)